MVEKKSWEEFINSKLLWWINTMLHTFGWAIVVEKDNDIIIDVYPARVKFRGFSEKINEDNYKILSNYIKDNITDICDDLEN